MGEGCDGILLKVQRLWLLKQGGTAGISVYYCLSLTYVEDRFFLLPVLRSRFILWQIFIDKERMQMTKGRYGIHGGQYMPEVLMSTVLELEKAYKRYKNDSEFLAELQRLYHEYANRPSMLYYAEKMTNDLGGAKIYLKREDLNHTGSHKINNVLGQMLLAKKWVKSV